MYSLRCAKKVSAVKNTSIHRAPNILNLQIKRFDFIRSYNSKINRPVAFDEYLDLGPFMSDHGAVSLLSFLLKIIETKKQKITE